jgi:hypothetical protein
MKITHLSISKSFWRLLLFGGMLALNQDCADSKQFVCGPLLHDRQQMSNCLHISPILAYLPDVASGKMVFCAETNTKKTPPKHLVEFFTIVTIKLYYLLSLSSTSSYSTSDTSASLPAAASASGPACAPASPGSCWAPPEAAYISCAAPSQALFMPSMAAINGCRVF